MKKYILGVDIGGTKCAVILGRNQKEAFAGAAGGMTDENAENLILDRISFPSQAKKGPDQMIGHMYEAVVEILRRNNAAAEEVEAIGISCGGPLDHKKGLVMNPPNLYGWNDIPIVRRFEERFGIPAKVQNDANAGAVAEWKYGAARGYRNVIFLTYGTGLGAGLILDGRLYCGTTDMAGEVGHLRLSEFGPVGFGKAGSLEGFCSGSGLEQLARMKVLEQLQMGKDTSFCHSVEELPAVTPATAAEAARKGDPTAIDIFRTTGYYLGRALSWLVDILNPQIIVCGSVYAKCEDLIKPYADEVMKKECLVYSYPACRIVPTQLGGKIGDFEALCTAMYEDA